MNLLPPNRLWILLLVLLQTVTLQASNLDKEKRWADQIVDSIIDGDAVWLSANDLKFLSIFTPAENGAREKALIVMHGTGVHPNWDQVVRPIRVEMTTRGWNTLSIQMPILANDAAQEEYAKLYPEVIPRIDSAVQYLKSYGSRKIVLVGHSNGSNMSVHYLTSENDESLKGLIAIGMSGGALFPELVKLDLVKVPVLDLFGSDDLPIVLENRLNKLKAARAGGNLNFQQQEIEGANHFFDEKNEELIEVINDWLKALP